MVKRKYLSILLMLVFLFTGPLSVLADGIGEEQISNYPGAVDYRDHQISSDPNHQRPKAGFSLQIKTGDTLGEEVLSGAYRDDEGYISPSQDSPVIHATAGSNITIKDYSTVGSGSKITQYDIQHRFTPKGEERQGYEITSNIVSSFNEVKKVVEEIKLDQPGTYEFYLEVADNAKCLPGAINWSANGNLRVINTSNPNFPKGIFWYFTGAVVEVAGEVPDFYPTPEGSTQWQSEYAECAAVYTYKDTDKEVKFPVQLNNSGVKDTTDFIAYFKDNPDNIIWRSNPGLVALDKGESKEFIVTIPIADNTKTYEVEFKANTNSKTPATEVNLINNTMVIKISPYAEQAQQEDLSSYSGLILSEKRVTRAYM